MEGSADGWLEAAGNPAFAEFPGLESGREYTVVAKHLGETESPSEKILLGNTIFLEESSQVQNQTYTLYITNGGYAAEVTRNNVPLEIEEGATQISVREGDKIRIKAPDVTGYGFKRWDCLIGSMSLTASQAEQQNPWVIMPAGDVVLQARYESVPATATSSNATVDYSPKNGTFALNMQTDLLEALKLDLIDNSSDPGLLASGHKVEYTVKFDRRSVPTATESNAVRDVAAVDSEALKIPWVLGISLSRKVDGINKALPSDGNHTPDIQVYGTLDTSLLGNMDYQLWKVENADSDPVCTEIIPVEPDLNDPDAGFTGTFRFNANVGDTIILTYSKSYTVTVTDTIRGSVASLKARAGSILEDADGYMDLECLEDYTDPVTGIVYEFAGFKKNSRWLPQVFMI